MCNYASGTMQNTWGSSTCSNGIWHGITTADCSGGYNCPDLASTTIDHTSEVMIIGFSNGGGFGMYLNWVYSDVVTKVVAIDYWGYADYVNWIPNTITSPTPFLNAHIFCACW